GIRHVRPVEHDSFAVTAVHGDVAGQHQQHLQDAGQREQPDDHRGDDPQGTVLPELAADQGLVDAHGGGFHFMSPLTFATKMSATLGVWISPNLPSSSRDTPSNRNSFLPNTSRSYSGFMARAAS